MPDLNPDDYVPVRGKQFDVQMVGGGKYTRLTVERVYARRDKHGRRKVKLIGSERGVGGSPIEVEVEATTNGDGNFLDPDHPERWIPVPTLPT